MIINSKKAQAIIKSGKNIKLNLGSGNKPKVNMINIDINTYKNTDVTADLNKPLHLIPDNSVNEIYSRHTFEHIDNIENLLLEIGRICTTSARSGSNSSPGAKTVSIKAAIINGWKNCSPRPVLRLKSTSLTSTCRLRNRRQRVYP